MGEGCGTLIYFTTRLDAMPKYGKREANLDIYNAESQAKLDQFDMGKLRQQYDEEARQLQDAAMKLPLFGKDEEFRRLLMEAEDKREAAAQAQLEETRLFMLADKFSRAMPTWTRGYYLSRSQEQMKRMRTARQRWLAKQGMFGLPEDIQKDRLNIHLPLPK